MSAKNFVESKLITALKQDPTLISGAGIEGKTLKLDIDGDDGGAWYFCFDSSGAVQVGEDNPSGTCDSEIWMKAPTFEKMVAGNLNVPMAFITRKIRVKGSSALAGQVGQALSKIFL